MVCEVNVGLTFLWGLVVPVVGMLHNRLLPGEALDALGDPTRRLVFKRLRSGARSVGEIAKGLDVSRPAVSQHLRVLKPRAW